GGLSRAWRRAASRAPGGAQPPTAIAVRDHRTSSRAAAPIDAVDDVIAAWARGRLGAAPACAPPDVGRVIWRARAPAALGRQRRCVLPSCPAQSHAENHLYRP